jgi:hypothetical protein
MKVGQRELLLFTLNKLLDYDSISLQLSKLNEPHWYKYSYKTFIKRFKDTSGEISLETWTERVALIYSWLPRIPLSSFTLETHDLIALTSKLTELESIYYDAELALIGRTAYLGSDFHGENIFPSYKGHYDLSIREFLEPAGKLLHGKINIDTQLSSTTKLLHFMCPHLFPIFDTKVCKQLFGTTHQTYGKYHEYLFSLQEFLREEEMGQYIINIAREKNLSPLYIVDLVLFNSTV